jgi:hypothetical protein
MDDEVVYMIRGKTREVCQHRLDRLCALLGAEVTTPPNTAVGRGWTARAVERTPDNQEPAAG